MMPYPRKGETCLKPIGELAQAIENTSPKDMILFTIMMGKLLKDKSIQGESVIIGVND